MSRSTAETRFQQEGARVSARQSLFGEGRAATTLLLWLLFILTLAMFSLFAGWVPTLVVDKGLPPTAGFSALLALNVGGVTGALILASLCDRWNIRNAMIITYAGMAISFWLFSRSSVADSVIPLAGLVGFFVLGAQCALYGVSPQLYPPANYSTGVGSAVAAGRIGSILGPIVAGYLMSHGVTANDVVLSMISTAILAGLVLLGLAAVSGKALKQPSARR